MYKDVAQNIEQFTIQFPKTIVPIPTKYDYSNGFIQRYFVQKANDSNGHVYEVDQNVYAQHLENPFWLAIKMYWRISGPIDTTYKVEGGIDDMGVRNSNKATISIAAAKIKNIGLYLPNLLQFHK
jgi:hypothetical protein